MPGKLGWFVADTCKRFIFDGCGDFQMLKSITL
jgi:phage terminase large subunit